VHAATVSLRRATMEDAELLYHWQCSPQTRRFAGNPTMPQLEGHKVWMEQKLATETTDFYLVTAGSLASGMIRLDACSDRLAATGGAAANPLSREVSILTAPAFYGCGIATKALSLIKSKHRNTTIFARVLAQNEASRKLFDRAGFVYYSGEYLAWSDQ
jgi:UDP-2,4-diacetamido-2,4,6-trideoxy-beta-L-altropyranose hydrolase